MTYRGLTREQWEKVHSLLIDAQEILQKGDTELDEDGNQPAPQQENSNC